MDGKNAAIKGQGPHYVKMTGPDRILALIAIAEAAQVTLPHTDQELLERVAEAVEAAGRCS